MSLEPTSSEHENPRDARRASGVAADGTPIYMCANCLRHKPRPQFDCNEYGRVHDLCRDCERLMQAHQPRRKFIKDRSHITIQSKVCKMCGQDRPTDEYWLDGKHKDGLKDVCGDCERKRRGYKSAVVVPQYDSYTPASALQPALDQAIAERDALAEEVQDLRELMEGMRRTMDTTAVRTDLLALHAIEDELRRVAERLDALQPPPPALPRPVRAGLTHVARVIGPTAHALFQWADKQISAEGKDVER